MNHIRKTAQDKPSKPAPDPAIVSGVYDLLVDGLDIDGVVQHGVTCWGWTGDGDPAAQACIQQAADRFAALDHMDPVVRAGLCFAMIQETYKRAGLAGDLSVMLRAAKELLAVPLVEGDADAD